ALPIRQAQRRRDRARRLQAHRPGARRRSRARARRARREVRAHPAAGGRVKPSVIVVDDDRAFRLLAQETLSSEGFAVRTASPLARGRAEIDRAVPDVLILDRRLPDGDGIDLLKEVHADGSSAPLVVVVTAYGDIANAVDALRAGAFDYLAKPVQP